MCYLGGEHKIPFTKLEFIKFILANWQQALNAKLAYYRFIKLRWTSRQLLYLFTYSADANETLETIWSSVSGLIFIAFILFWAQQTPEGNTVFGS